MKWDEETIKTKLKTGGGIPKTEAVVRFVAGCMKRERDRLALLVSNAGGPDNEQAKALAKAIMDPSVDEKVFEWVGPQDD